MDVETAEAIDGMRHDLQEIRGDVRGLRGDIQGVRTELNGEIQAVRTELSGEIQAVRNEVQTMRTDLIQHADVLYESLHDDIRIVAEGLASLTVQVAALASGRK